jgi:hypothetical protein
MTQLFAALTVMFLVGVICGIAINATVRHGDGADCMKLQPVSVFTGPGSPAPLYPYLRSHIARNSEAEKRCSNAFLSGRFPSPHTNYTILFHLRHNYPVIDEMLLSLCHFSDTSDHFTAILARNTIIQPTNMVAP